MLSRKLLRRYTVEQLQEALRLRKTFERRDKLEAERASLLKALAKVEGKLGKLEGQPEGIRAPKASRKRKRFSLATRRKMAASQKARWAKVKGKAEKVETATA